jgi:hypothetical protein
MNRATRIIVSTIGVVLGIAGFNHGFFETLQGNTPTTGLIISAIGEEQRMWLYGGEEAFTIVPNFLITGLLAMVVSLAIIIWSVGFIQTKYGPTIFLLLFMTLFLVGGGIGQVLYFLPTWAVATRINKPLTWWEQVLPSKLRKPLGNAWPFTLTVAVICFSLALAIAITGYVPGLSDPDQILNIDWGLLGLAGILMLVSFVSGFAYDIEARQVGSS